jgi:ribosome-binding factor A
VSRRRNPRVDEAVRQALATLLEEEIADPRTRFVTVTDVEVTEDHKHATVYYTVLDPAVAAGGELPTADEAADGLRSAAPRLQGLLSRRIRLRNTPVLRFVPDAAAAEGRRIDELLRHVQEEEGRRSGPEDGEGV